MYTYVGCDSHKNSHTFVFLNCFFEKLGEIAVSSTPSDFEKFFKEAQQYLLDGTTFAWGFEDVASYGRSIVKFLIDKKQLVKHVNASLVASERNSQNTLHKTDSVDAECCARVLLSRFDKLPLALPDDKLWILKSLVARRQSLVKVNVMLKNQLHSLIPDHYPSYHSFFSLIESKSALAFYETYPSPSLLADVTLEMLANLLKAASKGKVGDKKAKQILLAVEKDGVSVSDYQHVRDFTIQSAVRQLKSNLGEIEALEIQLEQFLKYFDSPLTTMQGMNTIMACKFISEIGDIRRFPNAKALAKYAGVSPVTYSSGSSNVQYASRRGNRQLNELFFMLAVNQSLPLGTKRNLVNPIFHNFYQKKVAEGKTKKQALKSVQRRLVNIVYRMMKDNEDFHNPPTTQAEPEIDIETKLKTSI